MSGVVNLGNLGNGVNVSSLNYTIGGTAGAASRNVIVANHQRGLIIQRGGAVLGNLVRGNYIGVDRLGGGLGNGAEGLVIFYAGGNTVGGTAAGARNVISGNALHGISIMGAGTANNVVTGNWIGLDISDTLAAPNQAHGVYILDGASQNIIGGAVEGARNIISGNGQNGVEIYGAAWTAFDAGSRVGNVRLWGVHARAGHG